MRRGRIRIGTSGWNYKHWIGTFYPNRTPATEQLSLYKKHFNTVELNNSFYMLPKPAIFAAWAEAVPANFRFAVKANRFITHLKKLNVGKREIGKFFNSVDKLGSKLGPILFQLPPRWKMNAERFEHFLKTLPENYRYTFEFRDTSWYDEKIGHLLREHNCAFCIYHLAGHLSPITVTADFVYVRLHGPGNKYQGSYTGRDLRKWQKLSTEWTSGGLDVYVYFDNDQEGFAAFNAITLLEMTADH